jgi:hypothetical protein
MPLRGSGMVNMAQILVSKIDRHFSSAQTAKMKKLIETSVVQIREIFDLKTRASPIAFSLDSTMDDDSTGGTSTSKKLSSRATGVQRVMNLEFTGDNRLRPISANENRFLVRRAHEISLYLKRNYKVDLDLRLLGSYKIYVWIALLAMILLFIIGFGKFVSSLEFDEQAYNYDTSSYAYQYNSDDYNYQKYKAENGGYR